MLLRQTKNDNKHVASVETSRRSKLCLSWLKLQEQRGEDFMAPLTGKGVI